MTQIFFISEIKLYFSSLNNFFINECVSIYLDKYNRRSKNLSYFYFTLILSPILFIDFKSRLHVFFDPFTIYFLIFIILYIVLLLLLLLLYFTFYFMLFIITIIIIIIIFSFISFISLSSLLSLPYLPHHPTSQAIPLYPLFHSFLLFSFPFLFLFGCPHSMGSFFLRFF